jgi:hypothetical protein
LWQYAAAAAAAVAAAAAKLLQVLLTFQPCTPFKSVLVILIYMFDV